MTPLSSTGALSGFVALSTSGALSSASGISISALDVDEVGDDGGWTVTATGTFPTDQPVLFRIRDGGTLDELCFGGTPGGGEWVTSEDGVTASFAVPTLPIGGPYDVYCESEDGALSATFADGLTVVHRSFTTTLYGLRSACPPPREVGPYSIDGEA